MSEHQGRPWESIGNPGNKPGKKPGNKPGKIPGKNLVKNLVKKPGYFSLGEGGKMLREQLWNEWGCGAGCAEEPHGTKEPSKMEPGKKPGKNLVKPSKNLV